MILSDLIPFKKALDALSIRQVLPTSLDTATLRQLDAAVRRQSFFSAQTMLTDLLDQYKADVQSILNPVTVMRDGRPVTEGIDPATARLRAKELLQQLGYKPEEGERGTLKDLS